MSGKVTRDDAAWNEFITRTAHRLMGLEMDSEGRWEVIAQAVEQIELDGGYSVGTFYAQIITELLYSVDGLIDQHKNPDHVRTVIAMRAELAQILDDTENER